MEAQTSQSRLTRPPDETRGPGAGHVARTATSRVLRVAVAAALLVIALCAVQAGGPAPALAGGPPPPVPIPTPVGGSGGMHTMGGGDMCAGDPIFQIGHDQLHVTVQVPTWALSQITSANPVIVRIVAPKAVTAAQIIYTGVIPEHGVIVYSNAAPDHGAYTIPVKVTAPDNGSSYPITVTISSSLQSLTVHGTSGHPVNAVVRVAQ